MTWTAKLAPEFEAWMAGLEEGPHDAILADLVVLQEEGRSSAVPT